MVGSSSNNVFAPLRAILASPTLDLSPGDKTPASLLISSPENKKLPKYLLTS